MDPSVYARAFGVQSESNKITITRVASNEIVYRRAVDTYRRDMASTMTSIQREQKRLKRNMRHYRRRLRQVKNLPTEKPFKVGWIACGSDSSFSGLPNMDKQDRTSNVIHKAAEDTSSSRRVHKSIISERDSDSKHNSKLQTQVNTFLQSVDEYVKSPHVKKQEESEVDTGTNEIIYDKRGRRRFLFGSSHIGKTTDLDFETDGYIEGHDFLSNASSDDEEVGDGGAKRSVRNRSQKKELLHLGSAYFTVTDRKDLSNAPLSNETLSVDTLTADKESVCEYNTDVNKTQPSVHDQITKQTLSDQDENKTKSDILGKKITPIFPHALSLQIIHVNENTSDEVPALNIKEQTPTQEKIKHRPNKVNFGDLIKFQHGTNIKKLFSMVDQLASKHGILSKEREKVPDIKRVKGLGNSVDQSISSHEKESTTKTSFFYAMKYGYDKHEDVLQNNEHNHSETTSKSNVTDKNRDQLHSKTEEQKESPIAIHNDQDTVDYPFMTDNRERKMGLPLLSVDTSTTYSRHSLVSTLDDKETGRGPNDTPRSIPPMRKSDIVDKRRSSILDASNYVSNMRRKSTMQEHYKMIRSENESGKLIGKGRRPPSIRKESVSEHQRKADDNKIAWSSALGRMKLIHTLADLTQFI